MLTIKKHDALIKLSGPAGEHGSKPIKGSLVMVADVTPCTCAPHHALVFRDDRPPLCVDMRATNMLVLPPEAQNLPLILGGKRNAKR